MKNFYIKVLSLLIFFCSFLGIGIPKESDDFSSKSSPNYKVHVEKSVMIPMRDGIRLSTDLYIPEKIECKLPCILIRTPYNKKILRGKDKESYMFAEQGFVVAVQDMRGKYESEGEYNWTEKDGKDGSDTITWISQQSWSNGKIGTYGCSYLGENQIQIAKTRNSHHSAMIAKGASATYTNGDLYRNWATNNGGAFELAMIFSWFRRNGSKINPHFPPGLSREQLIKASNFYKLEPILPDIDLISFLRSLPLINLMNKAGAPPNEWEGIISHEPADPWWDQFDWVKDSDRFDVPTILVDSWYDYGVADTLSLFNLLRKNSVSSSARKNQFVVIAPTTHCEYEEASKKTIVGERNLGDARFDYWDLYLKWFNFWLKGIENNITNMPKIHYYLMGMNTWKNSDEWPLAETKFTKYYLHSEGQANSRFGSGELSLERPEREPPDIYVYDPKTPVPTVGGQACCTGEKKSEGSYDQSIVETRHDVLVYTSSILKEGIEVTGPLEVVLYISSTAKDTDFTAKLVDVYPNGKAYNVQEGILRTRYREGFNKKVWMKKGEVYKIKINLHATANYFGPGHRIRLEVSSSNFPRFDRNLNTGGNNYDETEWIKAKNKIYHSDKYPSHIILPIIQ